MKILHTVEFYEPSVGGAQEVVKQLSERMAAKGHGVTVATTKLPNRSESIINGVRIKEFSIEGNAVRGINGETEEYKRFLTTEKFDVVMNYAAQQWATDLFFEVIDQVKAKKVLVPCGYSALYDPAYKNYFAELPPILKKYDATVYLSDVYRDIEFARKQGVTNLHVIPNGAPEERFSKLSEAESLAFKRRFGIKGKMILTVGNHTGEKGHTEAIKTFLLAPLVGRATLVIVGGGKSREGCYDSCHRHTTQLNRYLRFLGKSIVLLPAAEAVAAFKAADVFLFLSNIEASPLVLFEANAAKTSFVSAAVGNAAEISEWTGGGVIVRTSPAPNGRVKPSVADTILTLNRLFADPSRLDQLATRGRAAWEAKFTWGKITEEYLSLYREITHSR